MDLVIPEYRKTAGVLVECANGRDLARLDCRRAIAMPTGIGLDICPNRCIDLRRRWRRPGSAELASRVPGEPSDDYHNDDVAHVDQTHSYVLQ